MSKFKVGDKVKRIISNNTDLVRIGSEWVVEGVNPKSGWLALKGDNLSGSYGYGNDPYYFELATATIPTGFEVGKKYKSPNSTTIVEIMGVTDTHIWYKNIRTGIYVSNYLTNDFVKQLKEYIPPPPEEWRIVYKTNEKIEIGVHPFASDSEARSSKFWNGFCLKTIRVDV